LRGIAEDNLVGLDSERNEAYRQGIAATVEEDDIVVDIGTGSGLLALMAGTPRGHNFFI